MLLDLTINLSKIRFEACDPATDPTREYDSSVPAASAEPSSGV
ncbi:hypothetical protein [Kribbella shirazensis]|uniref:Uncharacterized protein n=1 Tax=Kribbella shirazensis TaxID=1105143 RepID=A0A7X5VHC6_9ACTN|nr:hypothetical protein [Kribbella shirazensis]NIK61305.1 hypothetical protein [Kribbella shirazensis]